MAEQEPIPIRISTAGVIEFEKKVPVKKIKKENVKWVAQDGGGPWIIKFDKAGAAGAKYPVEQGSPFSRDEYDVPQGGEVQTEDGPTRGKVKHTYRYTVTHKITGDVTHDPDIDVE
jgi:hypothetical protein